MFCWALRIAAIIDSTDATQLWYRLRYCPARTRVIVDWGMVSVPGSHTRDVGGEEVDSVSEQRHVIDRVRAATTPPTSEATFTPAFAPLSVGSVRCSSARFRSPADSASASTGSGPPADPRFGSSNATDVDRRL